VSPLCCHCHGAPRNVCGELDPPGCMQFVRVVGYKWSVKHSSQVASILDLLQEQSEDPRDIISLHPILWRPKHGECVPVSMGLVVPSHWEGNRCAGFFSCGSTVSEQFHGKSVVRSHGSPQ